MSPPVGLDVLTPASNTTLEPVTTAMQAAMTSVSMHFSPFRVTEIALTGDAPGAVRRSVDPGRRGASGTRKSQVGRHRSFDALWEYLELGERSKGHPLTGLV